MKPIGWLRRASAILVMLLATVLLAACGALGESSPEQIPADDREPPSQGDGAGLPQEEGGDGDKLIIRTKTLRLEVESTPDAITEIRALARTHSGSVTDMQVATDSEEWIYHYDDNGNPVGDGTALRGWVTVRVPSDSYEEFIDDVVKIGTLRYQAESTDDVTQEHVDMSARLQNLRAQEARLREFFDAAANVTEMLAIEEELGRVRGEIESLDAQVTYLERQAAMATVTLELTEPRAVVRPPGDSWGFVDAVTTGFRGAAQLLAGALTLVIASSPLWLAALVLFFPIRALVRRRRAKEAAAVVPHRWPSPQAGPPPPRPAPAPAPAQSPVESAPSEKEKQEGTGEEPGGAAEEEPKTRQ